ncbi:glucan endo-1,3-beta-D-glucosidase [Trifolium repens]|nr:glucan endo-1,3-beta-D-glucosidase [Trifolium repens]
MELLPHHSTTTPKVGFPPCFSSKASIQNLYSFNSVLFILQSRIGTFLVNDTTNQTYCIAMDGFDSKTLQATLDWACGPWRANCSGIQLGESCYKPNNVKNHASYAFDSYYQKEGKAPGSCDFKGVAMITITNPTSLLCPATTQYASFANPFPYETFRHKILKNLVNSKKKEKSRRTTFKKIHVIGEEGQHEDDKDE